ncbi:hypothetical protein [Flavivirga spongiicola]|uniref:Uncharacterized protein n=1 Tax=Flavivirga spongiicola TaxID=421621 RepID=A0ABU7XX88_9FLAO|nr:hypothetical protein [Flavivirga sp. MEBiC05379]MDO5980177.1 hypothetical protein [Flavivirga sp. MEBiC05379]
MARANRYSGTYKVITNTSLFCKTNFGVVGDPYIWDGPRGFANAKNSWNMVILLNPD